MRSLFTHVAAGVAVLAVAIVAATCGSAAAHPLDPLSAAEIATAVAALHRAGHADQATRFAAVELDEPAKEVVLGWRPGQALPRKAAIVARRDRTVYEGVVDLAARRIERWQAVPGVQSAVLRGEWDSARRIAMEDAGWRSAMAKRGYAAVDTVFCAPLAAGNTGDPGEAGRRLVRVVCFDREGTRNVWARPIEGLVAVVDLDEGRVLRLLDRGPVPVSREPGKFGLLPYPSPKRGQVRGAVGASPGLTVAGYQVRWKNWSFHYRLDGRAGLVVSLVRHADAGHQRMVLYRGSLSEMFVPYMDPDPAWSFRTWLDVGEYGFGRLASPLVAGSDCPAGARMLDAVLADDWGAPLPARSVACLFERRGDAPLWRHAESASRSYAGRPARELVLRTIPSVGNYDYVIDWVLTEAGALRIDVGATGIVAVKGVATRDMRDPSAAQDAAHGMLVAPGLAAVNHDHFLSFRLDVDIDGAPNTLVRQDLVPRPGDGDAGRRGLWAVAETPVAEEGPVAGAGPLAHPAGASVWRIVNPNMINRLGQHPGYELRPGHNATSLLAADDIAQRRAAFSAAPLWLTAYDPGELYAAGRYPNQSRGGDGLPAFAAQRRPVRNADIVLWYTMGFHHLTRPEDWPVMATVWHSVALVPYGFFDRNPSLAAPPHRAGPPSPGQ
jgi:primary-amine oxidase